jgi:hypothetical protein
MTEQVNCPYCGHDRLIAEDTVCQCGVELCQTQTLRARIKSLEAQIIALRLEQGKAVSELCRRERLRLVKQGQGQTSADFWKNPWGGPVYGKPGWADRPKSGQRREVNVDMSDFT